MNIPEMDWGPLWLTMQLAGVTVVVLLLVGTPVAWWLAFTRSRFRTLIEAIVALPIVLPPTVLGFYLLVALGPHGLIGGPLEGPDRIGTLVHLYGVGDCLDLLFASFVVQPLHGAFEAVGKKPLEAAWSLGASRLDAFFTVASPIGGSRIPERRCPGLCSYAWRIRRRADGRRQYPRGNQSPLHCHL